MQMSLARGSPDVQTLAAEVLKAKTPHETLQVSASATHAEAKAQFKRIALLLHPDRTLAIQASEAFQKAAHAVQSFEKANAGHAR